MNDLLYPKITVIIPVYNVIDYITVSIESVLNQTYPNIEIIIVDDGSTDGSEIVCDKYKKKNDDIIVVHQNNQGLSGARNTGIDIATGDFLFFLDSDDLIFPDALTTLYRLLLNTNSEIAIGGTYTSFAEIDQLPQHIAKDNTFVQLDSYAAIEKMLYSRDFSTSAWGKLYKTSIFQMIRFPVGKYYEDLYTTYKVFLNARKISYTTKFVYCYFKRLGSISMERGLSIRQFDCIEALDIIQREVITKRPELNKAFQNCYISFYLRLLQNAKVTELDKLKNVYKMMKRYRLKVIRDNHAIGRVRAVSIISFFGLKNSKIIVDYWYKRKRKVHHDN